MKIIYQLVSVDLATKSGVLMTKPELPKNGPWKETKVSISNLLAHRIEKNKVRGLRIGDSFLGTKFSSEVNSPEFSENPFKLVEFVPTEDSDVPHNFQLRLVTEKRGIEVEIIDFYQNKSKRWQNRSERAKNYMRYELVSVTKKLKDVGKNVNIIPA